MTTTTTMMMMITMNNFVASFIEIFPLSKQISLQAKWVLEGLTTYIQAAERRAGPPDIISAAET